MKDYFFIIALFFININFKIIKYVDIIKFIKFIYRLLIQNAFI